MVRRRDPRRSGGINKEESKADSQNAPAPGTISIGETVREQLQADLALEREAVARLDPGIETCRGAGDNGSRVLFEEILEDEEEHINWLEAQLALID